MGAIIGGISGFIVLLFTYFTAHPPSLHSSKAQAIREVRMTGIVDSTKKNSAPGMLFPGVGLEPLRRSDYDVIGIGQGNGCAHYVALWPLPVFWVDLEGGTLHWFTFNSEGIATDAAWFDAINELPTADTMLSPRTQVKETGFAMWYRRDCVHLTGKGIEIKLDKTR